jgi:hypothetical protein
MSALATLETGLLLGLYALLAGIWGVLWALTQFRKRLMYGCLAIAAYGLHALAALTIILSTPPGSGWKCLIVVSSCVSRHTADDLAPPRVHPSERGIGT